jgi:fatty-acid desaturase
MKLQLIGKIGIVALVVVLSFLAAWSGSGPAWGAVSAIAIAIAIGGGVAVAVFRGQPHRCLPHRSGHPRVHRGP